MCRVYSAILICAHVSWFIAAGISAMDTPYRNTGGVRLWCARGMPSRPVGDATQLTPSLILHFTSNVGPTSLLSWVKTVLGTTETIDCSVQVLCGLGDRSLKDQLCLCLSAVYVWDLLWGKHLCSCVGPSWIQVPIKAVTDLTSFISKCKQQKKW